MEKDIGFSLIDTPSAEAFREVRKKSFVVRRITPTGVDLPHGFDRPVHRSTDLAGQKGDVHRLCQKCVRVSCVSFLT